MGKSVGRLGWIVLAVVPPSGVAVAQLPGVAGGELPGVDPTLAAVLLVGYEAVLGVLAFVGGIAGELSKRCRNRIVDRLDLSLRRRMARFDKRYQEFVLSATRFVDLKGLATVGPFTPELDEIFIDVSLAPMEPHNIRADLLADVPVELTARHSLGDFLDGQQPRILAVIGVAGSGKTTLLRHTARRVCRSTNGRRTVPILLFLRDHVSSIVADRNVSLPAIVRGTLRRYRDDEPQGWFEQRLCDGDCVVLLDGLDEVARPEDRRVVSEWVESQIRQYPKNDYVIASRPHGFHAAEINGAEVLQVRCFTQEQVAHFVRGWYRAVEQLSTGAAGEDIEARAEVGADDLLDRLKNAPGLYELTVNPLLLTMIANVHRYRGTLPGKRAELYGEICQVILWRRQEAKKLPIEMDGDKKELLLALLAFTMMDLRVRDLSRDEIVEAVEPTLRRVSGEHTVDDLLADIGYNGLLIERENRLYAFAHHTFQEYLAAVHLRDQRLTEVLPKQVDDAWWRETTLLYATRSDSDSIIHACLDSDSVTALALAFDCAEHAREIAPGFRARLEELLESSFDPGTEPHRRRLMIRVMVSRHLSHLTPVGEVGRICAQPVTATIYRLFTMDTQCEARDGPSSSRPSTAEPVVGVLASEATAFVRWVNELTGGEPGYRLPTDAELAEPAVQRALNIPVNGTPTALSAWAEPAGSGGEPHLWTPADRPHPHAVEPDVLAAYVAEDLAGAVATLSRLLLLHAMVVLRRLTEDLDRNLVGARKRADELVRGLDHAVDISCSRAFDVAGEPNLALTRAVDPVRARALELVRALDWALNRERALSEAHARALAQLRALDRVRALDLDIAHRFEPASNAYVERTRERASKQDLESAVAVARGLAADVGADLDNALDLDLGLNIDLTVSLQQEPHLDDGLDRVVGRALASALSRALASSEPAREGDWRQLQAEFCRAFVAATLGEADGAVVPPSSLAGRLSRVPAA
ncbi:MAG: NACHT domain-containing protein, partial [Sciscionella sp.]